MMDHLRQAADALAGYDRTNPGKPLTLDDAREAADLLVTLVGKLDDLAGGLANAVDGLPMRQVLFSDTADSPKDQVGRAAGALNDLDAALEPALEHATRYRTTIGALSGLTQDDTGGDEPAPA
ncbi:MAG TPA: hypothetical protein VGL93_10675 [Streptosporangiaceae bacterium]|jgi:hypothetical protein